VAVGDALGLPLAVAVAVLVAVAVPVVVAVALGAAARGPSPPPQANNVAASSTPANRPVRIDTVHFMAASC
jgi:hypothetical protein